MSMRFTSFLTILFFGTTLVASSLYVVKETERAVKLRFGEVIESDLKPGLGFKIPIMHEIRRFDARVLGLELRSEDYLTQEKKRLSVDSYVMWRIENPQKFYTAANGLVGRLESLLAPRVNEGLRNKFGERTVYEVVSGEREQLMVELTKEVSVLTEEELGIKILDIRVKKIDLPPNVSGAVYDRMRAERQREAREHRSQGKELAEGIRADADRKVRIIRATAYKEAEMTRGRGDAEAASIYAKAYGQDKDFYRFYRSLTAYSEAFSGKQDIMLLSPEGDFFEYMKGAGVKQN